MGNYRRATTPQTERWSRGGIGAVLQQAALIGLAAILVAAGLFAIHPQGPSWGAVPRPSSTVTTAVQAPTSDWTNLTFGTAPSARSQYAMTYDSSDHEVVLFGGLSSEGAALNDTWVYSNGSWTNVTASAGAGPSARYDAAMTYDSSDGYVLLVDGTGPGSNASQSAWEFASGHWKELSSNASSAVPADSFPEGFLAYDSSSNYTVFVDGSSTYEYTSGSWLDVSFNYSTNRSNPEPTNCGVLADYPPEHGVLCVGGSTWLFNGTWTNISSALTGTPPPVDWPAATYDPLVHTLVLFGGGQYVRDPTTGQLSYHLLNETWALSNSTWWNVTNSASPPADNQATLVWDSEDNMTVLFGGLGGSPGIDISFDFTWSWGTQPILVGVLPTAAPSLVDVRAGVSFSVSFMGGVAPFSFSWTFGDGAASILRSPVHAYALTGNYSIVVSVKDSLNHSAIGSTMIQVVQGVAVNLSGKPNPTDVGLPVSLSAVASGGTGNLSTSWSFGDGTRGTGSTTTHAFGSPGNYSIRVWVKDTGGGNSTGAATEHVNSALGVPTINATPNPPDLGQLVNFTATESGGTQPYTFSWLFGDGGTGGNLTNISHIFTTNGPFTAAVTVRDGAGASMTSYLNLTVALNLSILGNASAGAAPLTVGFQSKVAGGTPGYSYVWKFGDGGRSSLASPAHDFTIPGSYTTTLAVTDAVGHSAQAEWNVFVAAGGGGPLAVGLVAVPPSLTLGNSTLVTASLSGGVGVYAWTWGSSNLTCASAGLFMERCTPSSPGLALVTLIVTDSQGHTSEANAPIQILGGGSTRPPIGGNQSAGLGTPLSALEVVGVIAAVGAVAAAVVALRRSRRDPATEARAKQMNAYVPFQLSRAVPEMPRETAVGRTMSKTKPSRNYDEDEAPFNGMV
jgi:PKD repeat protein